MLTRELGRACEKRALFEVAKDRCATVRRPTVEVGNLIIALVIDAILQEKEMRGSCGNLALR
jgi:hypothetical protein